MPARSAIGSRVCVGGGQSASDARAFFENDFAPVEVSAGRLREGLFTGYYEPQLHGSRTRHGAYQTPVYGLPADLVSVDLGLFRPALKGERIAGRIVAQTPCALSPRARRNRCAWRANCAGAVLRRRSDRGVLSACSGIGPRAA